MSTHSLSHLSDGTLRDRLAAAVVAERTSTSVLLAHIAEFDARRLYAPAGYGSMREFCVHELRLSEDAASKRIYAAHTARRFPTIFQALADGRLHLSAIVMLGSHLREAISQAAAEELIAAAYDKTRSEIELMLAHRSPKPPVPAFVAPLRRAPESPPRPAHEPPPAPTILPHATPAEGVHAPGHAPPQPPPPRVTPLAPQSYRMQLTMDQEMFDDLEQLYELASPAVRPGDVTEIVRRSFKALICQLGARKYGATNKPRKCSRGTSSKSRQIPAEIRRAVAERDGRQCTFKSDSGRRCSARHGLEYDHVVPVARGGSSTVGNLRLRCRAHNQYEAEQIFGRGFIEARRTQQRPG